MHMPFLFEKGGTVAMLSGLHCEFVASEGWRTILFPDALQGDFTDVVWPHPEAMECSPIMVGDRMQIICTIGTDRKVMASDSCLILPPWASGHFGWYAPDISVWSVFGPEGEPMIGWEVAGQPLQTLGFGLTKAYRIYRVVPVTDRPLHALVTLLANQRDYHTFLVSLDDDPKVHELLIDGGPVYKSSLLGGLCAHAILTGSTREVCISDSYSLEPLALP